MERPSAAATLAGRVACRADVETTLLVPALRHTTSLQEVAETSAATVSAAAPFEESLQFRTSSTHDRAE